MAAGSKRLQLAGMVAAVTLGHLGLLASGAHHGADAGRGWQPRTAVEGQRMTAMPASAALWRTRTLPPEAATASIPLDSARATAARAQAPPPTPAPPAHSGTAAYLPRDLLTMGPRPLEPIVIAYPPEAHHPGKLNGRLAVYIDERGAVRRVEPLDNVLTGPVLDAARTAFLGARFMPGERQGQAVRTRLEVEVSFEAEL